MYDTTVLGPAGARPFVAITAGVNPVLAKADPGNPVPGSLVLESWYLLLLDRAVSGAGQR